MLVFEFFKTFSGFRQFLTQTNGITILVNFPTQCSFFRSFRCIILKFFKTPKLHSELGRLELLFQNFDFFCSPEIGPMFGHIFSSDSFDIIWDFLKYFQNSNALPKMIRFPHFLRSIFPLHNFWMEPLFENWFSRNQSSFLKGSFISSILWQLCPSSKSLKV